MSIEYSQIVQEKIKGFLRYKERVNLKLNEPNGTYDDKRRYYMKIERDCNKQCDNRDYKVNDCDVRVLLKITENINTDDYASIFRAYCRVMYHTDSI